MSEAETERPYSGNVTRRQILRSIALALTGVGSGGITLEAGRFIHSLAQEEGGQNGSYQPKFFNDHEFQTVSRLAELIIPADGTSGSAVEAGAPEFFDLLCSQNHELASIYTGGILWLDRAMKKNPGDSFVASSLAAQHRVLLALAEETREQERKEREARSANVHVASRNHGYLSYTGEPPSSLGPGGRFFVWVRRLTVDAFYTSPIGIKDIDYQGNAYWERYRVPQEAIDYALERSPFKI